MGRLSVELLRAFLALTQSLNTFMHFFMSVAVSFYMNPRLWFPLASNPGDTGNETISKLIITTTAATKLSMRNYIHAITIGILKTTSMQ